MKFRANLLQPQNLNRFEYLQLACSLLPKEHIAQHHDPKNGDLNDVLASQVFNLAQALQEAYEERYRYEGENAPFELNNEFERN